MLHLVNNGIQHNNPIIIENIGIQHIDFGILNHKFDLTSGCGKKEWSNPTLVFDDTKTDVN